MRTAARRPRGLDVVHGISGWMYRAGLKGDVKPIIWMGSSREDLRNFPEQVRRDIGQALYTAQQGETDPAAKPLKGFGAHV